MTGMGLRRAASRWRARLGSRRAAGADGRRRARMVAGGRRRARRRRRAAGADGRRRARMVAGGRRRARRRRRAAGRLWTRDRLLAVLDLLVAVPERLVEVANAVLDPER